MKVPMIGALVVMVLMAVVILAAPDRNLDEMNEVKKPQNNKYTKILFDAKSMKKFKAQAKKRASSISKNMNPKQRSAMKPVVGKKIIKSKRVVKVVSKLKKSGFSKLLGRISKRSINTAQLIQRQGKAASSRSQGRAVASIGATTAAVTKIGKTTKSFRVSGVKTSGKGGGKSNYKGSSGLAMGGIGESSVGVLEEETLVEGGIPEDVIARVIKSNLGQIRYCYERQLTVSPDLYGKLLVSFEIGSNGAVIAKSIGNSTLKNSMVEGCVLRRIGRWKFPKPKGGTVVRVKYPFLFKSTN